MGITYEQRVTPFLVETPSIRQRKLSAIAAANQRAERRVGIARLAACTPGTLEQKRLAIEGAIKAGLIPMGSVPSISTISGLIQKYESGHRSAADYRDDLTPRGRRGTTVPKAVVDIVHELAIQHGVSNYHQLLTLTNQRIATHAPGLGIDDLTIWRLRRVLRGIGEHTVAAGRQGSRAAELDVMPRSTYPTKHTHELWLEDEGDTRFYFRGFCRVRGIWVSCEAPIVLIRDHRSGAIVGHWVVDPSERLNPEGTACMTAGFDAVDVLAAMLSAACPEIAAGCEELSGALAETFRWDNAQQHKLLEQVYLGRMRSGHEVDDPDADEDSRPLGADALPPMKAERIPKRRPDRNGGVERLMQVAKAWLVGFPGHKDEVIPTDRLVPGEDLGRDRSEIAVSNGSRQPRLDPVDVMHLKTIEELRAEMARVVRRYNEEHVLRRHGMSPLFAARRYMPQHVRRGEDLIRTLPLQDFKVDRGRIEVERDGRSVVFAAVANGMILQNGAIARVYVDPMLRALWLDQGRHLVLLKPQHEAAQERSARDVATTASGTARRDSDAGAAMRQRLVDERHGTGAAAQGWAQYEEIRSAKPEASAPSGSVGSAPAASSTEAASASPALAPDTIYEFDPDALMP